MTNLGEKLTDDEINEIIQETSLQLSQLRLAINDSTVDDTPKIIPEYPQQQSKHDINTFISEVEDQSESSDDDDDNDNTINMTCVCPLGVGIEDIYGEMHTLIPRQTEFCPIFTNAYAYQTTATIRIFQGEHNLTKYNVCYVFTLPILSFEIFLIICVDITGRV